MLSMAGLNVCHFMHSIVVTQTVWLKLTCKSTSSQSSIKNDFCVTFRYFWFLHLLAVSCTMALLFLLQLAEPILEDKDFVKWSPSRVWEEEKAANGSPVSTSSSLVDVSLPILRSHDSRGPSPIIGTLSLPSVFNSTTHKMADKHAMEVLGPVEYVRGQPIRLKGEGTGSLTTPTKCRVLTMLYRRSVRREGGGKGVGERRLGRVWGWGWGFGW